MEKSIALALALLSLCGEVIGPIDAQRVGVMETHTWRITASDR